MLAVLLLTGSEALAHVEIEPAYRWKQTTRLAFLLAQLPYSTQVTYFHGTAAEYEVC
jgi:hypothetical protein